jgi:hypothetical protein
VTYDIIRHREVCRWSDTFSIGISMRTWGLGLVTHDWGWRWMILRWHVCVRRGK